MITPPLPCSAPLLSAAGEVVKVRAMDFANGQLVLGTKNNEVLRVDLQSRQVTVLIEVNPSIVARV